MRAVDRGTELNRSEVTQLREKAEGRKTEQGEEKGEEESAIERDGSEVESKNMKQ